MTDEPFMSGRERLTAKTTEAARAGWDTASAEMKAWDLFRWVVIALLSANFLLGVLLFGRIRSDIAELAGDRTAAIQDIRDEVTLEIKETKAELTQMITDMRTSFQQEVGNTNAKLEQMMRPPPKPVAPPQPPKPTAKPRRR